MSVADGTEVAISADLTQSIEFIEFGQAAWVGDPAFEWSEANVSFRNNAPSPQPVMFFVVFGNDEQIVVTPNHPFLTSGGQVVRAGRLEPGDTLLRSNGQAVVVEMISNGPFQGGVRGIAFGDVAQIQSLDGHLIVTAGVISGDFYVETSPFFGGERLETV